MEHGADVDARDWNNVSAIDRARQVDIVLCSDKLYDDVLSYYTTVSVNIVSKLYIIVRSMDNLILINFCAISMAQQRKSSIIFIMSPLLLPPLQQL